MTRDRWYKKRKAEVKFPSIVEKYHLKYEKLKIKRI